MNTSISKSNEILNNALVYLKKELKKSDYFKEHNDQLIYRIEHTIRVTNIGIDIAKHENLDVESMALACILHDLSYSYNFNDDNDRRNHGRTSAKYARDYLNSINYDPYKIEKICFAISIHVDNKSDMDGIYDEFAYTVRDADNIDRFDVYRIYENFYLQDFQNKDLEERLSIIDSFLNLSDKIFKVHLATPYANKLWLDKIKYQREYYIRIKEQMELGKDIIL